MQIVIEIPDRIYSIVQNKPLNIIDSGIVEKAIKNGTPLPKGHGRLIDISPYEQREAFATSWMLTRKIGQIVKNEECIPLSELPTVIEADKDGE